MTLILLCFLSFLGFVLATNPTVSVVEPLDKQLVQVARLGQPYFWTFSPFTFSSSDGPLVYTTSSLPGWLSFDNTTGTFRGTPSTSDEGYPDITVTAHASGSSTSSRFTICVTHVSPPTLKIPLSDQFRQGSHSLSSVFFLRPNSALVTQNPVLRVPGNWSFSVGIESETIVSLEENVFYEIRLANGSDIPEFLSFNSKTVTLDGTTEVISQPSLLAFHLHASDQEGYTSNVLPFDLVIADHELSMSTPRLPTINTTTETEFAISFLSPADFMGVLVDDDPIQPSSISMLDLDVSAYSWLRYDAPSRTLSGTPPANLAVSPQIPVTLTTNFNQTIKTELSLALVEPYFVLSELPSLHVSRGDQLQFDLAQWFSHGKSGLNHTDISVFFDPTAIANWLRFDGSSNTLTGSVPEDYESADHVTLTFTAYSHETQSTSHTTLTIYITGAGNTQSLSPAAQPNGLSSEAHRRLVLALALTFGLLGGLCLLAGTFAIVRRCARVEDTAILGEEGRNAWDEKDRRWYGLTLSPRGTRVIDGLNNASVSSNPFLPSTGVPNRPPLGHNPLGLDLRRVSERSQQHLESGDGSPGVMSKKEFIARIKDTVRQVSDKYRNRPSNIRPVIGKPVLVASSRANDQAELMVQDSPSNPFSDLIPPSRPGSTFISGSPSASTAEHSIPRRRADFAPPRNLGQVHFNDGLLVRQVSTGSMGTNSFLSGKSGLSGESYAEVAMGPPTKPRLVPFTSSTRVPVPQVIVPTAQSVNFSGNRIASQKATVIKVDPATEADVKTSASNEEMSMGIHYVRSLGTDQLAVAGRPGSGSSPALSNVRSSFPSLESSHLGYKSGTDVDVMKVLVRAGERFKFRVPIPTSANPHKQTNGYFVKLTSGQPLPKFIRANLNGISKKGALEVSGTATFRDLGERTAGVYSEKDGVCIASFMIEVVGKR